MALRPGCYQLPPNIYKKISNDPPLSSNVQHRGESTHLVLARQLGETTFAVVTVPTSLKHDGTTQPIRNIHQVTKDMEIDFIPADLVLSAIKEGLFAKSLKSSMSSTMTLRPSSIGTWHLPNLYIFQQKEQECCSSTYQSRVFVFQRI